MLDCNSTTTPYEFGLIIEKEGTNEQVDETESKKIVDSLRYIYHT